MEEWQQILADSVTSGYELAQHFPHLDPEEIQRVAAEFPLRINSYYMRILKETGDPGLLKGVLPDERELDDNVCMDDPLTEEAQSPVPGVVHRYPDRVLLYVAFQCPIYCRYCTRKRKVSDPTSVNRQQLARGFEYIRRHPEIRDVILSGGDPLLLRDEVLEPILRELRSIPHVEILRIGTRVPSALPQRVTTKLVRMMKKYHPIYIMTHFDHPVECTPEAKAACARLADHGFPMQNQTVLLRGVNDEAECLTKLFQKLLTFRVKPYYLYQADLTKGTDYFRTALSRGMRIMRKLRGHTSGLAVPYFIIDAPGGGGKIPVLPKYVVRKNRKEIVLRNYRGDIYTYPQVNEEATERVRTV